MIISSHFGTPSFLPHCMSLQSPSHLVPLMMLLPLIFILSLSIFCLGDSLALSSLPVRGAGHGHLVPHGISSHSLPSLSTMKVNDDLKLLITKLSKLETGVIAIQSFSQAQHSPESYSCPYRNRPASSQLVQVLRHRQLLHVTDISLSSSDAETSTTTSSE